MREILLRHVDASLRRIDRQVLPEVGELQPAADLVGELLPPRVAVAEQVEDQVSDGVGRAPAVVTQRREGRKGLELDVGAERL